jgi:hypothetical protein
MLAETVAARLRKRVVAFMVPRVLSKSQLMFAFSMRKQIDRRQEDRSFAESGRFYAEYSIVEKLLAQGRSSQTYCTTIQHVD